MCSTCRCDADPSALAKYVVALVKKDKSEKELKALCIDQLDVFLQKGNIFQEVPSYKALCRSYLNHFGMNDSKYLWIFLQRGSNVYIQVKDRVFFHV